MLVFIAVTTHASVTVDSNVLTLFVTTHTATSQSINSVAPAPLISVPPNADASHTVIALLLVVLPDVITKWSVSRIQVSNQPVFSLIANWI